MTGKHMTYERGGLRKPKKKARPPKKSQPAVKRQLKAAQRQVWNVLGGVGFITVVIVLFQLARGGW